MLKCACEKWGQYCILASTLDIYHYLLKHCTGFFLFIYKHLYTHHRQEKDINILIGQTQKNH